MLGLAALQRLHSHLSGLVPTTPSASPEELVELRTMAYSLAKQQGLHPKKTPNGATSQHPTCCDLR
eukprot:5330820-Amphidinium_carterae.1